MKTYYYVHTGHRIGLDRFRRATTILRALGDEDITLLCSDFRIAQIADEFGIAKSVGIDVVRNIPHITEYRDRLIFDSDEANPIMLDDMKEYFAPLLHLPTDFVAVDDKYFDEVKKKIDIALFFGDDDYSKDLGKLIDCFDGIEPELLLGFYYFLDYEDELKSSFKISHEFEDYDKVIQTSKVLITSSPQAVLENLASGGKPIYFQREDYTKSFLEIFKKHNVPIIQTLDNRQLLDILDDLNQHKYYKLEQNIDKVSKFIKNTLGL